MTGIKYTASTTFTVPTGVSIIYVSMVGGGASGMSGGRFDYGFGLFAAQGNGGQAGSCAISVPFPCSAGQVISVFVGAGGVGSAVLSAFGVGSTSYITYGGNGVYAAGGQNTVQASSNTGIEVPYGPTSTTGGFGGKMGNVASDARAPLAYGRNPANAGAVSALLVGFYSGGGGNSLFGDGGNGGNDNQNGTAGLAGTGAGGGGCGGFSSGGGRPGATGGSGCVIIEY